MKKIPFYYNINTFLFETFKIKAQDIFQQFL